MKRVSWLKAGHSNTIFTVRDVVDSAGAVKASYEFDPDGRKISPPNTEGVESPKTWIGGLSVNDDTADAGLYLMGHRFYDPSISRFLNRDPIGFAGVLISTSMQRTRRSRGWIPWD